MRRLAAFALLVLAGVTAIAGCGETPTGSPAAGGTWIDEINPPASGSFTYISTKSDGSVVQVPTDFGVQPVPGGFTITRTQHEPRGLRVVTWSDGTTSPLAPGVFETSDSFEQGGQTIDATTCPSPGVPVIPAPPEGLTVTFHITGTIKPFDVTCTTRAGGTERWEGRLGIEGTPLVTFNGTQVPGLVVDEFATVTDTAPGQPQVVQTIRQRTLYRLPFLPLSSFATESVTGPTGTETLTSHDDIQGLASADVVTSAPSPSPGP